MKEYSWKWRDAYKKKIEMFFSSASEKGGAEINNSLAMSIKGRVWPSGKVRSLSAAFTSSHPYVADHTGLP